MQLQAQEIAGTLNGPCTVRGVAFISVLGPPMQEPGVTNEPVTILRLCGSFELGIAGVSLGESLPSGQATTLLAYLATSRRPLSREELIGALWSDRAPSDPQAVLSTLLSRLRRVLGRDALGGRGHVVLTLPKPVWLDVDAAREAVAEAQDAVAASAWSRSLERCGHASDILGQEFLAGHEAPWIDAYRRDLEDLHVAALEAEARGALNLGGQAGLDRAASAANALLAIAPYREVGYRLLMEALEAGGNIAEAVRVYARLHALLRDELGTAPAPELRDLHERLVTGDARDDADARAALVARQPILVTSPARVAARADVLLERETELRELRAVSTARAPGKAGWSSSRDRPAPARARSSGLPVRTPRGRGCECCTRAGASSSVSSRSARSVSSSNRSSPRHRRPSASGCSRVPRPPPGG